MFRKVPKCAENKQRSIFRNRTEITNSELIMINFWMKAWLAALVWLRQENISPVSLVVQAATKNEFRVRFPFRDSCHSCSLTVWFTPMKTLCNEKLSTLWNQKLDRFFFLWFIFSFFYCILTLTRYLNTAHRFLYCAWHEYANICFKWSSHLVLILRDLLTPCITSPCRNLWWLIFFLVSVGIAPLVFSGSAP